MGHLPSPFLALKSSQRSPGEIATLLAKYALAAFVLRCVLVWGYRILVHPLNRYPGPFVAKFTDWYGAYHAMRMQLHLATYRDHQRYGRVMRHGPNKLVFNSATAYREIYQNPRIRKSRVYLVTQRVPGNYSLLNALDPAIHRPKRRIIGQGLSQSSMQKFEPNMLPHLDTFVKQLIESTGPVNVTDHCKRLGIDIIGHLGFGASLNLQTNSEYRWVPEAMSAINGRTYYSMQFPKLYWLMYQYAPHNIVKRFRYIFLLVKIIKARLAEDTHARNDFFSFVMDVADPETGQRLTKEQLWEEAAFLFPAGGDTTTTTVTALIFYLSRYPECYKRLAEEIRGSFQKGADIRSGPKLSSCNYLRACIDEALRMSSPAIGMLWREQSPDDKEPLLIDGHYIPPGTRIAANIYSVHHNTEYFDEPFAFKPERWLNNEVDSEESRARKKTMLDAFMPFSIGTRSCAGKAMAYMESSIAIAKTLWFCDFERPQGKLDGIGAGGPGKGLGREKEMEYQIRDIFVSTHDGPYLIFKPRGRLWEELYEVQLEKDE